MMMRPGSWYLELAAHTHSVSASYMVVPGRFHTIFLSVSLSSRVILGTDYHNSNICDANIKTKEGNEKKKKTKQKRECRLRSPLLD